MSDLIAPITAISIITALYYRYNNDAMGSTVFVDPKVPRMSATLPIVGGLRAVRMDINKLQDILYGEMEVADSERMCFTMPGMPPYLCTINPDDVEHVLVTNFEKYEKGSEFKRRTRDLFGKGIFASDGTARVWHVIIWTLSYTHLHFLYLKMHQLTNTRKGLEFSKKGCVQDIHD